MATWRDIPSSEKDSDSPVTATLVDALDQNPQAIAEGAENAPKNEGASMDIMFVTGVSSNQVVTNVTRISQIIALTDIRAQTGGDPAGSASITARYRLSSDNGSTWGSWDTIINAAVSGDNEFERKTAWELISIAPTYNAIEFDFDVSTSSGGTTNGDTSAFAVTGVSP